MLKMFSQGSMTAEEVTVCCTTQTQTCVHLAMLCNVKM